MDTTPLVLVGEAGQTADLLQIQKSGIPIFQVGATGAHFLGNVNTSPATPSGGGHIYVEGGSLKYKGPSGTVTTLAVA